MPSGVHDSHGKNRSREFGRNYDGRRGVIVCSECLEDKTEEEVEQVKDGRSYKYICDSCRGDEP